MDLAYDHIAEQTYTGDRAQTPTPTPPKASATTADAPEHSETRPSLQSEFQETFKAFSSSPWGSKLGGLWGTVRKQGESLYEGARREAEATSGEALKGFTDLKETLVGRTRGLSLGENPPKTKEHEATDDEKAADSAAKEADPSLQENETFITRFRSEAAKRLKEIEKAEDAADEALLRFGTNVRNFLKEAVSVAPPSDQDGGKEGTVLFESKDSTGKRVFHTSRFDAQLHVIHTSASSFSEDPSGSGDQWSKFKDGFNIESKTDAISKDLDSYPDLRTAMERLVPEKVEYKDFWLRYYFLRHVVEAQDERRKELLKATSANNEEEVRWDEDSDEETADNDNAPSTPQQPKTWKSSTAPTATTVMSQDTNTSTTTLQQQRPPVIGDGLRPEGRRSHDEKSVADSDASYDLVSGATSRTPGSPKEDAGSKSKTAAPAMLEESDEEDWE